MRFEGDSTKEELILVQVQTTSNRNLSDMVNFGTNLY